jgi:hypothetical protein
MKLLDAINASAMRRAYLTDGNSAFTFIALITDTELGGDFCCFYYSHTRSLLQKIKLPANYSDGWVPVTGDSPSFTKTILQL